RDSHPLFIEEMTHAQDLVYQKTGMDAGLLDDDYPAEPGEQRRMTPQKSAKIHHRQQVAAHVGNPAHPSLGTRNPRQGRTGEDFGHLPHRRHESAPAQTKPDSSPVLSRFFLSRQRGIALIALSFERSQDGKGRCVRVHHAVPPQLSRAALILDSSSVSVTGLVM